MNRLTLTEKGIGPIPYDGYNYWVAPAVNRVFRSWQDQHIEVNGIRYEIPTIEELNNVIYKNMAQIDATDITAEISTSPLLTRIGSQDIEDIRKFPSGAWAWSSTETPTGDAWNQRFSDGFILNGNKNFEYWIIGIYKEPINKGWGEVENKTHNLEEKKNMSTDITLEQFVKQANTKIGQLDQFINSIEEPSNWYILTLSSVLKDPARIERLISNQDAATISEILGKDSNYVHNFWTREFFDHPTYAPNTAFERPRWVVLKKG